MKPIKFEEVNTTFAENQPEYTPLPVSRKKDDMDTIVSCWSLSFKERLTILFTGKLWVTVLNFYNPLTPMFFSINKKEVIQYIFIYMRKINQILTSVKIDKELYNKVQIEMTNKNFKFTKLVERAIFLYLTNKDFQKQIHDTLNTSLEG